MARRDLALPILLLLSVFGSSLCAAADSGRPNRDDPPELRERLAQAFGTYRCAVTAYLSAIHAKPFSLKHRYLILVPKQHPDFYVQCVFFEVHDEGIRCEAASHFYNAAIAGRETPDRLAILAELGFSTDGSKGNFFFERAVKDQSTISDVAEVMVATLVRYFDYAPDEQLVFNAPLLGTVRDKPLIPSPTCTNVSALEGGAPF